MLRPLNSEIALSTVRRSAPSTSRLKLPELVRWRPTWDDAVDCCADAGTAIEAVSRPARNRKPMPARLARILISLPRQWNGDRLGLPVRRDFDHHGVPLETRDHTVLDLVALAEHEAVATHVLGHGELVLRAPHD